MKSCLKGFPFLVVIVLMVLSGLNLQGEESNTLPVRGADEIFWVPTLEQALDMGGVTGKPIFIMGYSLVGDGSTYTKLGADYCTGVF